MNKIAIHFFVFVLLVSIARIEAQDIKEFYIECNESDFEYMYENYTDEIFIPIILKYNGTTWSDVRMRVRGDSSREYPKKSLKVIFDSDPFITGQDVLNFNAEYQDKSYLHSVLSSIIFQETGIDCANMEHIRLYLNGDFYGLYVLTENMDKTFLETRNYNTSGNFYKATKDGACLSVFDNIYYHWEKKLNNIPGRMDIAELIYLLNQINDSSFYDFLHDNFVYPQVTSFMALNMLLANGSTYYHNYYLYNDANNTGNWFIFPWDLDRTFTTYSKWLSYHRSSGSWVPDNPLLERSIISDEIFFDIKNKLTVLNNTVFNENFLFPLIDSISNIIEPSVFEDLTDNIQDIETWNSSIDENKDFITDRYSLLINQMNHYPYSFEVHRLSGYYLPNEQIQLSWNSTTDPNGDNLLYNLYYGKDRSFEDSTTVSVQGLTETSHTISNLSVEGKYYFKVEVSDNSNIVPGFDTYNTFYVSPNIPNLVINEINYNSSNEYDTGDWIEFYNPDETVIDLSSWFFSDENNEHRFYFPTGTTIGSKDYIVLCRDTSMFFSVFPDTIAVTGNLNFGLKSSGELIRLYHYTGYLVDSLVYDNEFPWPSEPNGEGPTLELLNPGMDNAIGYNWNASVSYGTPGKQNSSFSPDSYAETYANSILLYQNHPNPFINYTDISFELIKTSDVQLEFYRSNGNLVVTKYLKNQCPGRHTLTLSTIDFKAGIYIYQVIIGGEAKKSGVAIKVY